MACGFRPRVAQAMKEEKYMLLDTKRRTLSGGLMRFRRAALLHAVMRSRTTCSSRANWIGVRG